MLRKRTRPVRQITEGHRRILSEMARLMYKVGGVGLAAPQVGINESMCVVDTGGSLYKLVNPKITRRKGTQAREEGCLSIPGVFVKVKRAKKVTLCAQDEFGKKIKIEAEDLLACAFQHELDHLEGRLIIDYASLVGKLKFKGRLKELKRKAGDEGLSEPQAESGKVQLQL